jgi:outer membrane protein assembly factor BamB
VQLSGSAQSAGAPALGDAGIVYVAAGNTVEAYRREDGELVWSTDIGPDVATGSVTLGPGGVLYVGTETGRLLAIATESKGLDPEAAWPALRHDARNSGRTDR